MEDLSLHILHCAQNSIRAGATLIAITIEEKTREDMLSVTIEDNGKGMDKETLRMAQDPFFSTKPGKRIGLGISMLAQATQEAGGRFFIDSHPDKGTKLHADFKYDHIDRKPLGSMADTIIALLSSGGALIDITYAHVYNDEIFEFTTVEIKRELQDVSINEPAVLMELKKQIADALNIIRKE